MKVKLSKSYARKVNLRKVSSQYDNIEHSAHVEAEFDTDELSGQNLEEKTDKVGEYLANLVRVQVERDILDTIANLFEFKKDAKNEFLLGIGRTTDYDEWSRVYKILDSDSKSARSRKRFEEFDV